MLFKLSSRTPSTYKGSLLPAGSVNTHRQNQQYSHHRSTMPLQRRFSKMEIHFCKCCVAQHSVVKRFLSDSTVSHEQIGTSSSNNDGSRGFLDIPVELRLIIYSFQEPQGHIQPVIDTDRNRIETTTPDTSSFTALASLSRTCKTIYHETYDKLYSGLHVKIQGWPDSSIRYGPRTKAVWAFLIGLPLHLKHVRHIQL